MYYRKLTPEVHTNFECACKAFIETKMALVARLQKTVPEQTNADITNNLETLQFESALTEEEKQLLRLRAISHAQTVSACAQATFLVSILHEARFSVV